MSHYIDYNDPNVWDMIRKSHCLPDDPTDEELQQQLDLAVGDARVWSEAEAGDDDTDLACMFGFVVGDDTEEAVGITEYDRHRHLAEFHMTAAMMQKKLGDGSTFDESDAAIAKFQADDRIDRRGAVEATRSKS
jgi:hypothetical protein